MNPNAARTATLGFRPETLRATKLRESRPWETLASGLPSLDAIIEGFPRGAISEIIGPESSGRTTLIHSLLAASTSNFEVCAYVDTSDSFDPVSASAAGVALSQLIWIRCASNPSHALKATDLLLHAGGFGVVILDLCQLTPRDANRIPISYWYRFRLALENTPTILTLVENKRTDRSGSPLCASSVSLAKSCASLLLEMKLKKTAWTGTPGFQILREVELEAIPRKPIRPVAAHFKAKSLG